MRTKHGFTLLELMVALGVFAIALLATLASIASSDQLRATSRETELAAEILNDRLERYQALGKSTVPGWQQTLVDRCVSDNAAPNNTDSRFADFGHSITVVILGESESAATFAIDKDGNGVPDPIDLDDDGNMNENGVNRGGSQAGLPAGWTGGASDAYAYSIIPVRVTVTWSTATGRGAQSRSQSSVTLVYPKG